MTTIETPGTIRKKRGRIKGQKIGLKKSEELKNILTLSRKLKYEEIQELITEMSKFLEENKQKQIEYLEDQIRKLKES